MITQYTSTPAPASAPQFQLFGDITVQKDRQLEVTTLESLPAPKYDEDDALTRDQGIVNLCYPYEGTKDRILNDALSTFRAYFNSLQFLSLQQYDDYDDDALTRDLRFVYEKYANTESFVTEEQAIEIAMELAPIAASKHYSTNRSHYQRVAIEMNDILQFMYERVLVGNFLVSIRTNPFTYTETSFRKSFYAACRNSGITYYRMMVLSQKRGTANTRIVAIDDPDSNVQLTSRKDNDYFSKLKRVIDKCTDKTVQKAVVLLMYEKRRNKSDLRDAFPVCKERFDQIYDAALKHIYDHQHILLDGIIDDRSEAKRICTSYHSD